MPEGPWFFRYPDLTVGKAVTACLRSARFA